MKPSKCFRHDMFPWKAVRANLSAINTSAHLRFIISLVARAGFAPAFRGYEPLVLSYATTAPEIRIRKWKWSGWQELNLRGHVPKTCGWPLPYTRTVGEGLSALPCLTFHTHHLAQRVH